MALASPAASVPAPKEKDGLRPLVLPWDLRLTAEQFALVCQANPDAVLELSGDSPQLAELERRLAKRTSTGAMVLGNEVLLGAIPMDDMDLVLRPPITPPRPPWRHSSSAGDRR